jgi:hypothetical protein
VLDILAGRMKKVIAALFLAGSVASFGDSFYTSSAEFQAALGGLAQQTITFDDILTGTYDPLIVDGVTFKGAAATEPDVHVASQADWTMLFFNSPTGNSVASVNLSVLTPTGVTAVGFLVGASYVVATGNPAVTSITLTTQSGGETQNVSLTPAAPFPFFGVVTDVPITRIDITGPSLSTIDNFTFAGVTITPEPSSALLFGLPLIAVGLARRNRSAA